MKSNLTKITVATILAITILTGLALYVKANILTEESISDEYSSYMLKSDATADLSAITKAHVRTAEYTSAEYTNKMAPTPSAASEYLAMYDDNIGNGYKRKSAPTSISGDSSNQVPTGETYGGYAVRSAGGKDRQSTKTDYKQTLNSANENDNAYQTQNVESDKNTYGGYAVRSAGGKDVQTTQTAATTTTPARNVDNEYGGYAVRSADGKDRQTMQAQTPSTGESYGGYAVRSADGKDRQTMQAQTPSTGESYGGYAVRSAGGRDRQNTQQAQTAQSGETYGGYAVRSAKGKDSQNLQANSRIVASTKKVGRSGGVPQSAGIKVYSNKGYRMSIDISQRDRNVIIMPVRGRSIAGVVIQDDPGRSIIVQSTSGSQSTYRYGEIDALVNL